MPASDTDGPAFWQTTPLTAMSTEQWESLCDGCGKCCLNKYADEETGAMRYTSVACVLLDQEQCRCADYEHRAQRVSDCVTLTPATLRNPTWLPETCAYRRLAEGRPLPDWHPLLTGDPASVFRAGHTVYGRVHSERDIDNPMLFLIDWVQ